MSRCPGSGEPVSMMGRCTVCGRQVPYTDEVPGCALNHEPAPAVPVGVQPASEEVLHNHGGHSVKALGCSACDAYYSAPAVPVVHPAGRNAGASVMAEPQMIGGGNAAVVEHLRAEVAGLRTRLASAERRIEEFKAEQPPCDEGCDEYPEETCSRHGRKVREVWEMCADLNAQLRVLAGQVAAIRALFAGGPDTPCRTVWHDHEEFVEVPMFDLCAALVASSPTTPEADS